MASTVTTELPPLQNPDVAAVDFVGSSDASPGHRSSVGDDEDNQSEGTVSELDPVEGAAALQPPRAHGGTVEVSRARGFGMSQYHSISELSSPSAATVSSTAAAAAAAFCIHPSSSSSSAAFDFSSQQLYGRSTVDSVHVLRDMFQRQTSQSGLPGRNGETGNADGSDADDEEEWATDHAAEQRTSCDDDEYFGHSVNVSMSSVDELSADEELNDLHPAQPTAELNASGNGMPSSGCSDSGSAGDDVIEAKRARMESIVTSMRPALQQLSTSGERTAAANGTDGEVVNLTSSFRDDDPKRRPKRKQYIPKQHDTSSGIDSPSAKQQMMDSGEETPTFKDRNSLLPVAEKMALESELRGVNDQLTYIRRKYAHLFDDAQQITAGIFASRNANDYADVNGRAGKWRESGWSRAFHDAFGKHVSNEWKQLVTRADGGLPPSSALDSVSKQQKDDATGRERYGPAMQSSPLAGDTPVDIQQLAGMLRMEITERVESLVNDIIRNFVAKYGLATAADCSSLDTATESKFKPEPEEKSPPEGAPWRADTVSSGSAAYAEDLSPGRDADSAERLPTALMTSSSSSFLSVPNLILPSPRHPTSTLTVEETTPPGAAARSLSDDDAPVRESSLDRQSNSRSDMVLSTSDQTAFDVPSRTAHHPAALYSLFAPHAYYPNASRMAAAAAAAAAVAANSTYPPVPPAVASSMLFPRCREPEQTEALPLVVNAPTKKKRTKVTDTRLSPRAARSLLHDGHRHHHAGSYHAHPHHHQSEHARADSSHHHRLHHGGGGGAPRVTNDVHDSPVTDRCRSSSATADSAAVSPFIQSRHPSTGGLPPLPLLPASLPTSVAVPNPSLQHSDIMSAIFQFSQQRIQQQQQQIDATQSQRFAPPHPPHAPFADKFDFKQLASDTQTSAADALHGSLPSARKAAETNGGDAYESIFHEDGLVSFTSFSFINTPAVQ